MIEYLIPLLASFLTSEVLTNLIYPLFCVYFIAVVPSIFRSLNAWR